MAIVKLLKLAVVIVFFAGFGRFVNDRDSHVINIDHFFVVLITLKLSWSGWL